MQTEKCDDVHAQLNFRLQYVRLSNFIYLFYHSSMRYLSPNITICAKTNMRHVFAPGNFKPERAFSRYRDNLLCEYYMTELKVVVRRVRIV